MTDIAVSATENQTAARPKGPALMPARYADLKMIHARLMEAIETSPFYSAEFKAYETARLTPQYLASLVDADPHHVIVMQKDGEPAGFMISGPELGTLWLYWSYLFPENRRSNIAISAMRAFIEHWDNGRFHKIATYTKTGNDAAAAIMNRMGFRHTATLEQHIFGEDYLLYERMLNKATPGYDHGTTGGLGNRLRRAARLALRR